MYLLLSPAKNLNEKDTPNFPAIARPVLLDKAKIIADRLKGLGVDDIATLMSVSDKIAKLNVERNRRWQADFDDTARPAVYLFDGDAYRGLDAYELSKKEIDYLQTHLGLLSGLYGLLKPLDDIMPYRLEMGTKLSVGEHKDLYGFWGDDVTDLLNARMAEIGSNTLINLASNEYFKVINRKKLTASVITPKFLDKKNGEYKMISFYAKRARGLMTRFCAVNDITTPSDLKGFDMEGYYFCKERSTDDEWVFLREEFWE